MILLDFFALYVVPAHAGGVDLSQALTASKYLTSVPAHAGGVDLSRKFSGDTAGMSVSPPMRAGWI